MKTENYVHEIIIGIDDWDEVIPGIGQSMSDLYDCDFPDYLGLSFPLPDEYLCDPDTYCEEHGLPSFEQFLIEKDYVEHIEEVYWEQDSTYRR
jgi:hypothetical protein